MGKNKHFACLVHESTVVLENQTCCWTLLFWRMKEICINHHNNCQLELQVLLKNNLVPFSTKTTTVLIYCTIKTQSPTNFGLICSSKSNTMTIFSANSPTTWVTLFLHTSTQLKLLLFLFLWFFNFKKIHCIYLSISPLLWTPSSIPISYFPASNLQVLLNCWLHPSPRQIYLIASLQHCSDLCLLLIHSTVTPVLKRKLILISYSNFHQTSLPFISKMLEKKTLLLHSTLIQLKITCLKASQGL